MLLNPHSRNHPSLFLSALANKLIKCLHDVMYVLGLKKNLVSISALEVKGMRVAFIRGKVLTWPMESCMRDAFTLGLRLGGLYGVNGRPIWALVRVNNHQSELWHWRFAHLHYEALSKVRELVFGMPEVQANHDGVCLGCVSWKKSKEHSLLTR